MSKTTLYSHFCKLRILNIHAPTWGGGGLKLVLRRKRNLVIYHFSYNWLLQHCLNLCQEDCNKYLNSNLISWFMGFYPFIGSCIVYIFGTGLYTNIKNLSLFFSVDKGILCQTTYNIWHLFISLFLTLSKLIS